MDNPQFKNNEKVWKCDTYGERRSAWKILMGKPQGKRDHL